MGRMPLGVGVSPKRRLPRPFATSENKGAWMKAAAR
jgi:hypothetical protein